MEKSTAKIVKLNLKTCKFKLKILFICILSVALFFTLKISDQPDTETHSYNHNILQAEAEGSLLVQGQYR